MRAQVDPAVVGEERLAGKTVAGDSGEAGGGNLAGLRIPREQQMARLMNAMVSGDPQQAGIGIDGAVEFTAPHAVLVDDPGTVHVDGEQDRAFLAHLRTP